MQKINFNIIKKTTMLLLLWYAFSTAIIVTQLAISLTLQRETYFHPIISIFIRILLICDLFVIPLILVIKYILKDNETKSEKILNITLVSFCMVVVTLFLLFNILSYDKPIFNLGTVKMRFNKDIIRVEESVWGESYNYVFVYKVENFFFVTKEFDKNYITE